MTHADNTSAYGASILRTALGTMFIAHALLKILVFTPAGTAGFFASLGLPGFLAYPTIAAELVGGMLLLVGYQTRWVALALIPILVGSIVLVHGASGWQFSNEGGGWEYPLFLIAASLAQAFLGDGAFSLSARLGKRETRAAQKTA
ncbi:MAG TPA: LysR family transcriptional regulator [Gammaproteobacteria bacterium]|jgi:putative oxidoreductase|nr:LysR family transcriptional regulator [Gammaproteobacteria bacterium]